MCVCERENERERVCEREGGREDQGRLSTRLVWLFYYREREGFCYDIIDI